MSTAPPPTVAPVSALPTLLGYGVALLLATMAVRAVAPLVHLALAAAIVWYMWRYEKRVRGAAASLYATVASKVPKI